MKEEDQILKKEFYNKLDYDKIKVNWNKNPITMKQFLSFLTVEVERSYDHLGACNGWTLLENKDLQLIIKGGFVNGVEYIDSLQYGIKLSNSYNNYVNPFFLFDILTKEGRLFFIDYYKEDIEKLQQLSLNNIAHLEKKLIESKNLYKKIAEEVINIKQ